MEHLLVESALRATILVTGCALVLWAARIRAPSVSHAVWASVMVAMLTLPAWRLWGPDARLPLLPQRAAAAGIAQADVAQADMAPALPIAAGSSSDIARSLPATPSTLPASPEQRAVPGWRAVALASYGLVALILLAQLVSGTLLARRLVRRSSVSAGHLTSVACASPVTVGWFRPVVVLPATWREWSPGKLDAVLAHEAEHARRRHPFVQWLALFNRAIFWFHPVAWWLPRQLSALAEQTCDDAVLARGHDPRAYSQYLIETAHDVGRAGRLNLAGVFMPGQQLSQRIRRILTERPQATMSRSRAAAVTTIAVLACVASLVATPVPAVSRSQQAPAASRVVIRPVQPRAVAPDSPRPQPVSLEWLEGDEWAFEVHSIATSEELAVYGRLANARQRESFIDGFWATRDPTPGTDANEVRDEYVRRVQFARSRFPASGGMGFNTDRGRMYLMFGAPDAIETEDGGFDQFETWRYASIAGFGDDVRIRFALSREYGGAHLVSPAAVRTLGVVRLYPLGVTAISIPVDAKSAVAVRYQLRNRGGEDVDHGEIGFVDGAAADGPLANHVPQEWFAAGFGSTNALPPDTYTLATAVRLLNGEIRRDTVTFDVE